jgi:two-component sensor histidine kinase
MAALLEPIAQQFASFLRHEQSQHAFETIFSSSPDGMLLVDAEGVVRGANARARELFGEPIGVAVAGLLEGGAGLVEHGLGTQLRAAEAALFNLSARGVHGTFAAEVSASAARSGTTPLAILAVRDLTERRRMEEALKRSVEEKETLLREVHHRVKNNLQIVSSLVALQAERLAPGPPREALSQMVFRVLSMAKVHQQLYGTEHFERVDLGGYARSLAESLQSSLAPDSLLVCDTEPVEATIDVAVPAGLILNELLTNAFKHGRIEDRCEAHVSLHAAGDGFVLAVRDRGPGFDAQRQRGGSLGMLLLRQLSRQLRAQLEFRSELGTEVFLRVPRLLVPRAPGLGPALAPH